nr:hypothetical protein [Tanacetum cinerariifolium]
RTPQQNGIDERKNRTLIEAPRTILTDSLLPIPVWVEAVNTACYVQNRVLVTKPHNKTPYELLLGTTPSIGFIRPFGCPVTIFNTLDPLGIQEHFDAEKAREEHLQQYMLFPLWSFGTKDPQNTDDDATFDVKKPEFNGKKPESEVHVSPSSSAKTKKHDDKTNREAQGKIARIEAIRLFLAYASFMGFMVYQIDVKSAFLDETIKEEVYVYQPSGFEDLDYPDKVYVDDIIFGSTNKDLCKAFEKLMKDKFQTSSMGELTFFLGIQVKKNTNGIFISQSKYVAEILRKFGLTDGKSASTPIDTEKPLLKDPDDKDVDVHTYRSQNASEGFDQILDFLNANSIQYALTINPIIYVSCIKEFWSSVLVKKTNDVVRLQALIDRKKVIITKDTVCQALRLDDAESIDCLPNKEIFTELARMGAKRIAWNEFSSPMASAVICLATVVDDVAAVDVPAADAEPTPPSPTHATTPPPPQQLPSTSQVAPTPPPSTGAPPSSPPQQPQPSKPTTISMELLNTLLETCTALTRRDENLEQDKIAQALKITKLKQRVRKLERKNKLKALGGIIDLIDADKDVTLEEVDAAKNAEDDEPKPTEINEVIEVVTTTKLMTEVVIAAAAPSTAAPSSARRRKGIVIRDPKETATPSTIVHSEPNSKDKGKGIMVQEPKPLKKQAQIEQDEAYVIELEAELKKNINWDVVIEQVKRKEKEDNVMLRYQALKRKPQTKTQARKNMMVYLKKYGWIQDELL